MLLCETCKTAKKDADTAKASCQLCSSSLNTDSLLCVKCSKMHGLCRGCRQPLKKETSGGGTNTVRLPNQMQSWIL